MNNFHFFICERIDKSLQQAIFSLRHQVFTLEQGIPQQMDQDGKDLSAIHLVVTQNKKVIATARLEKLCHKSVLLSRIAVKKDFRKKGLAREIVKKMIDYGKEKGFLQINVNAHHHLIPFYKELQFKIAGEPISLLQYSLQPMHQMLIKVYENPPAPLLQDQPDIPIKGNGTQKNIDC
ncbi:GNAT family N-acetyltransferase [Persicobacter diffluens]|uniref:N-acetyltransferase domain-containing protein n=1 Tax=Persicobacter diffluens TaxID=981 RepID=A0AAN4W1A2_9BACT|nr:hypothetical protein PEDI_30290 [Persicobacter diffluens]